MTPRSYALALAILFLCPPRAASAHQLDETLQASLISFEHGRVEILLRLVPGVAVAPTVIAEMDIDHDGSVSDAESRAYVERVVRDVSISADARPLELSPSSWRVPAPDSMRAGLGEIQITLVAVLPQGPERLQIVFTNRHEPRESTYMVNALVPSSSGLEVFGQERSADQSIYRVEVVDRTSAMNRESWRSTSAIVLAALVLIGAVIGAQATGFRLRSETSQEPSSG